MDQEQHIVISLSDDGQWFVEIGPYDRFWFQSFAHASKFVEQQLRKRSMR